MSPMRSSSSARQLTETSPDELSTSTDREPSGRRALMSRNEQPMPATALTGAPRVGPPPVQMIMELAWGMWSSAVIRAAAQLRIADTVDDDPVDVREMAVMAGADPDALARLMRALASFG